MNYPFPNAGLLSQGTGMGLLGGGGSRNLGGEFSRLQTMNAEIPRLALQYQRQQEMNQPVPAYMGPRTLVEAMQLGQNAVKDYLTRRAAANWHLVNSLPQEQRAAAILAGPNAQRDALFNSGSLDVDAYRTHMSNLLNNQGR